MKGFILLSFCFCLWAAVEAQFSLPFEVDCSGGRLIDPFLVQALKSKYPKKFSAKLDFGKDLGYDAKYKLGTAKLLARHLKNINALNYDVQNLMLQQQQQAMLQQQQQQQQQQPLQQLIIPDQAALLAQQQQQQLQNIQIPLDAARSIFEQQANPQLAAFSQIADQRFQQPIFQLTGAPSTPSSPPEFQVPCEEEAVVGSGRRAGGPLPGLSSVFTTCLGVLKDILK